MLTSLGLAESREAVKRMIDVVDADGSGLIEFNEFLTIIKKSDDASAVFKVFKSLMDGELGDSQLSFPLVVSTYRRKMLIDALMATGPRKVLFHFLRFSFCAILLENVFRASGTLLVLKHCSTRSNLNEVNSVPIRVSFLVHLFCKTIRCAVSVFCELRRRCSKLRCNDKTRKTYTNVSSKKAKRSRRQPKLRKHTEVWQNRTPVQIYSLRAERRERVSAVTETTAFKFSHLCSFQNSDSTL